MSMFSLSKKSTKKRVSRPPAPRAQLRIESLESRLVPYAVSGNSWVHPELVTISLVPDGTNLGGATSNLFSAFNARWSQATWTNQIYKAAQVWAQQTNLNFQIISDNGSATGSGNNQQGDPGFGDIRIGGFNFGSGALAMAYLPPQVNNYSVAGDIGINTGQTFNIGSTSDLFTVMEHEIGHALGLMHSGVSGTVMWPSYTGVLSLQQDDIAGIRAVYSNGNPRSYDANGGANSSFASAVDVTGLMNKPTDTILVTGLDNTTASQQEYYTVVAPADTSGTMTVTTQSAGLSLLSPVMTVYDAGYHVLGSAGAAGRTATTLSVTVSNVSAGQRYYVRVKGADTTAFSTGAYGMTYQFSTYAPPPVPTPNTTTANGNPLSGSGGIPFNPVAIAIAATDPAAPTTAIGAALTQASTNPIEIMGDGAGEFDLLTASAGQTQPQGSGCNCAACRLARLSLEQATEPLGVLLPTAATVSEQNLEVSSGLPNPDQIPSNVNEQGDKPAGASTAQATSDASYSFTSWRHAHDTFFADEALSSGLQWS
jgi:hypothetical protein